MLPKKRGKAMLQTSGSVRGTGCSVGIKERSVKRPPETLMLAGIIALFMIVAARGAHADSITNGGGCVPNDATIKNQLHWVVTGGMRVKFQPAKMGTIRLVCPIPSIVPSGLNAIEVYYQDPDGNGTNYQVKAHLRAVHLSDGAYSTLCTVDSNTNASAQQWNAMSCASSVPLNSLEFTYWVEVEIFRNLTTSIVEFNAVRLVYSVD
jgi:hypothetical protein